MPRIALGASGRFGSEAVVQTLIRCIAVRNQKISPSDRYRPEAVVRRLRRRPPIPITYSITVSARRRINCGIVMPMVRALFRLITSS